MCRLLTTCCPSGIWLSVTKYMKGNLLSEKTKVSSVAIKVHRLLALFVTQLLLRMYNSFGFALCEANALNGF